MTNPNDNILKEISRIFYDCLWKGTAKNVIVKQYIEWGLKIINSKAFIKSLKATWIRRLLCNNGNWTKQINKDIILANLINYGSAFTEHTISLLVELNEIKYL